MNLPQTMRAIAIDRPGGPEVLKLVTRPVPSPENEEVVIRVIAAGVNRPDCLQRRGLYKVPADANPLPGLEVAGEIAARGTDVRELNIGDAVCALTHGGGYAEYVRVNAAHCLPIPGAFSMLEAAALPETFFTVYYNVFTRARLAAGETLLVHGGSSGIGTSAIQLGRAMGCTVFTTAGTDEKCRFCENLGADLAINYRSDDFVEAIRRVSDGVDVVLDMVAGSYIARNLALLRHDGRLAIIAFLGGSEATVNFGAVLQKRLTITGSTLRPQSSSEKAAIAANLRRDVWPLIDKGIIAPVIHATFPLAEAAGAHILMESSKHMGKIMLQVGQPG